MIYVWLKTDKIDDSVCYYKLFFISECIILCSKLYDCIICHMIIIMMQYWHIAIDNIVIILLYEFVSI